MSEAMPATPEVVSATKAVMSAEPYNGVYYSNLQLYSENISDKVDPNALVVPLAFSSYWPGGIPRMGGSFATVSAEPGNTAVIQGRVRAEIPSLRLSKATWRRWNDYYAAEIRPVNPAETQPIRPDYPDDEIVGCAMICSIKEAPLAILGLFKAVRHKHARPGGTIASLYFPSAIKSPELALLELQRAQQRVIEKEQI